MDDSDEDAEYIDTEAEEIDLEHEYDEDDTEEFVARATYFQSKESTPTFYGLTDEEIAKKEKQIERHSNGHYRSMVDHEQLHHQMMTCLLDFISREKMEMLNHKNDTSLNEALNNSVMSFAPKNKCFSGTKSLEARVCIAMGVNIVGHYKFWKLVFAKLGITMTDSLIKVLQQKDEHLKRKKIRDKQGKYKLKRTDGVRHKIKEQIKQDQIAEKEGKSYHSCSALEHKSAKTVILETLKSQRKSNKTYEKDKRTCKYYPLFCHGIGHTTAGDKRCDMNKKSKEDKKIASDNMQELMIEKYLAEEKESKYKVIR